MARIVIGEDEDHIRRMLSFRLERAGHEVLKGANGQEALDLAIGNAPDAVILDVMMPVMTGIQALRELKSLDATHGIPVIMLTAASQERDVVTGIESGAADYITKPFSFPELVARLNRVLAKKLA